MERRLSLQLQHFRWDDGDWWLPCWQLRKLDIIRADDLDHYGGLFRSSCRGFSRRLLIEIANLA